LTPLESKTTIDD